MRYHTKEYYTLLMALGASSMYEPVIDKEYSDEEIEELYQKAVDRYIEEERADYDEPPELYLDEDEDPAEALEQFRIDTEEYENREPFDEDEAAQDFKEIYNDNLEEPDEDLPGWVRDAVDPRILAMYFIPEKLYRRLVEQDEANDERFEELDGIADEALETMREELPEEYAELLDVLEELEDCPVLEANIGDDRLELSILGCDDEGDEELYRIGFDGAEIIENEGLDVSSLEDEDGDVDSDCELLYSEIFMEDGRAEVHMMFENNGLKYLTFRLPENGGFEEE